MLPYWLFFSAFAVGAIAHGNRLAAHRGHSLAFAIVFLVTAGMIGLRYEVGGDWEPYQEIYNYINHLGLAESLVYYDPAYALLNWVAGRMGLEIWAVNLVCGVIFSWGLIKFARNQPNPWLAMVVAAPYLIMVVAMGYSRQGVAIGLILASLVTFERRRYGRFVALMVLAAAFHKTAIVVLPLIALSTVRHRFVVYAMAAAIAALLFTLLLEAFLSQLMVRYVDEEMASDGAGVRIAMNAIPALIFLAAPGKFVISEQEKATWRNFAFAALAMVVALVLLPSSTVVDRTSLYLIPLQVFVLSRLPYAFPVGGRANGLATGAVLAYSAFIQLIWLIYGRYAEYWIPYKLFPLFE